MKGLRKRAAKPTKRKPLPLAVQSVLGIMTGLTYRERIAAAAAKLATR